MMAKTSEKKPAYQFRRGQRVTLSRALSTRDLESAKVLDCWRVKTVLDTGRVIYTNKYKLDITPKESFIRKCTRYMTEAELKRRVVGAVVSERKAA